MGAATKCYKYLRKLLKFEQMDFEFALWQMVFLFVSPQKVYRNFQSRKRMRSIAFDFKLHSSERLQRLGLPIFQCLKKRVIKLTNDKSRRNYNKYQFYTNASCFTNHPSILLQTFRRVNTSMLRSYAALISGTKSYFARDDRSRSFGTTNVLPVYIVRWFHYSPRTRISAVHKATVLYDIYRLSRSRSNSSHNILVKQSLTLCLYECVTVSSFAGL